MNFFELSTLLVVAAAGLASVNAIYIRLPSAIGILAMALGSSVALLALEHFVPSIDFGSSATVAAKAMAFDKALLEGMLGLLLFAGALHVKMENLRRHLPIVLLMASLGVAISTVVIGTAFSLLTGIPLLVGLVFGVIVSPTDPVAVLGVLKTAGVSKSLETKIAGESLLNDGVAYVAFLLLTALAFQSTEIAGDHEVHMSAASGVGLFVQEALGGAVLGAFLGWVTFRIMRLIDDYAVEVLLTLALVMGGYMLSLKLHVSAPIMAVMAGLFIGHIGMSGGMSERTRKHVDAFWRMIDEILNMILFLMIGLEVFAIDFNNEIFLAGGVAIFLSLLGRLCSVAIPVLALKPFSNFSKGTIPILTWGGIKGGISIALALSLPDGAYKDLILGTTYIVVIFSIIIQGLTIAPLAKHLTK